MGASTEITRPVGGPRGGIAMEDLIALNDEIAALARAGLPVERGLMGLGGDLPGRLGRIARTLGARMERGETLAEALEAERGTLPPTYHAVVRAGIRSGRMTEALEGLSGFARTYVELRRAVGLALLYPALVMAFGYALFVLMLVDFLPRLASAFRMLRVPQGALMRGLIGLGESVPIWGPILPIAFAFALIAWWRSGRASSFRPGALGVGFRWVPGMKAILGGASAAQFADWLALLIEQGVPWGEAVNLAAEATGDPKLIRSAAALADASRRGEPISGATPGAEGLPPLLTWLLWAGRDQDALVTALRHASETYRRRALRRAAALRVWLSTALLVIVGATATLVYTTALFAPWTSLLNGLTRLH